MRSFPAWKANPDPSAAVGSSAKHKRMQGFGWVFLLRSKKTELLGEVLTLKAERVMEINET